MLWNMQDIRSKALYLLGRKTVRGSGIKRSQRCHHQRLTVDNGGIVSRKKLNSMAAAGQHLHLQSHDGIFPASLLIPIMCNEYSQVDGVPCHDSRRGECGF